MRLEEASLAGHAKWRKQKIEHGPNAMAGGPAGTRDRAGSSTVAGDAYSPLRVHGLTLA